jgi:hypothetical protein
VSNFTAALLLLYSVQAMRQSVELEILKDKELVCMHYEAIYA